MKKIIVSSILVCLCIFSTSAQIGGALNKAKRAKNKASQKVQQMKSNKEEAPEEESTPSTTETKPESIEKEATETESAPVEVVEEVTPDGPNDGITSPTHEKYMGKIVWSNSADGISYKNENESLFLTEANLGEEIRFRVYMDNSLTNYLKHMSNSGTHGRYVINYYLDDKEIGSRKMQANEFTRDAKKNYTTFRGALKLLGSLGATGEDEFQYVLMENEAMFTEGQHKLRMEIAPFQDWPEEYTGEVVASGELILNVKGPVFDPNDVKVCLPKANMTNASLEAKVLKAFKAKGWTETPKEVRIVSNKWNIVRNEYTGIITSRFVNAVIGSEKEGQCAYQEFSFYQDYNGSSYQSEVYLSGIGSKSDVSCGCMK